MSDQEPTKTAVERFEKIGYTVHYRVFGHYVKFRVFEECGLVDREKGEVFDPPKPQYNIKGYTGSGEYTYDIEEASIFLHGSVKWDGCSNWHFDEQDHVMLHFCYKQEAVNLGVLMGHLYDIAAREMDSWSGD